IWIKRAKEMVTQAERRRLVAADSGSDYDWTGIGPDEAIAPSRFATWVFHYEDRGSGSSGNARAMDTAGLERALGAIATTFRLARLYPPTHPAVVESMHQVTAALPGLAELGPVEWRITATGLQWQGQQLLAGDAQVAELA